MADELKTYASKEEANAQAEIGPWFLIAGEPGRYRRVRGYVRVSNGTTAKDEMVPGTYIRKVPEPIDFSVLEKGRVYRVRGRNITLGVFDGHNGFIGIREKFGERFLDTEYEGMAIIGQPEPVDARISPDIPLKTYLGSVDQVTGKAVLFDKPVAQGGKGWYFVDTGEASEAIRPCAQNNPPLWAAIKAVYDELKEPY